MLIKVCGMRHADNIAELCQLKPDYVGFIFYEKSPRFAGSILKTENTDIIPVSICKTGVFVNAGQEEILKTVTRFGLNAVQLHGHETPELCAELKGHGLQVLKAFHPENVDGLKELKPYEAVCDFFLFDTPTVAHGGSGQKFDWSVLEQYAGNCPFFLSGGIGPDDAGRILNLKLNRLAGVDINSRFELQPGLKNIEAIKEFIYQLRDS
jgi:phosphoribosylanthranilate isomerase